MDNQQHEPDEGPVLYYDYRCSMCAAFAGTVRGGQSGTRLDGGNRGEALEYRDDAGVHTGWEAVVLALKGSNQRWTRVAGRVAGVAIPPQLGRGVYRWVAARRQVLSRMAGMGEKRP